MKAQELAAYFTKKIGKPIAFTINETDIGGSFSPDLMYTSAPAATPPSTGCGVARFLG